ncbi:hypothetical protein GQ44DRAFT_776644 [Phaeosphaeriaceae sp. PMI808]|nr:hypothetical protein GQ44DRAFT_776644 [Phaeosphaeriaceae sp. PMI808]
MTGVLRPMNFFQNVRRHTNSGGTDAGDYTPGLYRKTGNVTYSILPRRNVPRLNDFVLDKSIAADVAKRLADLGHVPTLFTFDIYTNAAIIPPFTDAASLEEILDVRDSWPFEPKHSQILAIDLLAGISSLLEAKLRRGNFDVRDVLLVCRNNTCFFQIAGIENCTCINDNSTKSTEETQSLARILKYVNERSRLTWYQDFVLKLETLRAVDSTSLRAMSCDLPKEIDQFRCELDMYLHAVHIFGTTLGGNSAKRLGAS